MCTCFELSIMSAKRPLRRSVVWLLAMILSCSAGGVVWMAMVHPGNSGPSQQRVAPSNLVHHPVSIDDAPTTKTF